MILPEKNYKRVAVIAFYAFIAVVISYLFIKYLLSCILPFAIAFITAHSTRKAVIFLGSRFRFKRKFSVFIITLSLLGLIVFTVYLLASKVFSELSGISQLLNEVKITQFFSDAANSIAVFTNRYFPDFSDKFNNILTDAANNIDTLLTSILQKILPYIGKIIVSFFKILPSFFIFTGVSLLAMFYFGCDYEKIVNFVKLQLNEKHIKFVKGLITEFFTSILKILRAYAVLILLTFLQLLTGFIIAGIDYAFLLSALIAIIDILPILGTGTVLIPWSAILLISGNLKTGLCILILYVIITITRQIAEPKILGSSVGLHPLVTLMSMYFGIKLIGVKGLILFPLTMIIIKNLNEKGFIRLYKINKEIKK